MTARGTRHCAAASSEKATGDYLDGRFVSMVTRHSEELLWLFQCDLVLTRYV